MHLKCELIVRYLGEFRIFQTFCKYLQRFKMMNDDRSFTSSTERERESERDPGAESRDKWSPFKFYDKILLIHLTENLEFIGRNWEMFIQKCL